MCCRRITVILASDCTIMCWSKIINLIIEWETKGVLFQLSPFPKLRRQNWVRHRGGVAFCLRGRQPQRGQQINQRAQEAKFTRMKQTNQRQNIRAPWCPGPTPTLGGGRVEVHPSPLQLHYSIPFVPFPNSKESSNQWESAPLSRELEPRKNPGSFTVSSWIPPTRAHPGSTTGASIRWLFCQRNTHKYDACGFVRFLTTFEKGSDG